MYVLKCTALVINGKEEKLHPCRTKERESFSEKSKEYRNNSRRDKIAQGCEFKTSYCCNPAKRSVFISVCGSAGYLEERAMVKQKMVNQLAHSLSHLALTDTGLHAIDTHITFTTPTFAAQQAPAAGDAEIQHAAVVDRMLIG